MADTSPRSRCPALHRPSISGGSKSRWIHAFLLLAILVQPHSANADVEPGYFGKKVASIEFHADQPIDRTHYDLMIGLKPGDVLTHTGLKKSLQALYNTGRFSMIAADARDNGGAVILVFELRLNYYFNSFLINGKIDLGERALWEVIRLPVGERFNEQRQASAREAVEKYFKEQGYFQVSVELRTRIDEQTRQIDTDYSVAPGGLARISAVEIRGVPAVEAGVVREKFGYKSGGKFNRSRLRRRLEGLKDYFVSRGNLGAVPVVTESYQPADNSVALVLEIRNYGKVHVAVSGFKIDRNRLRRLLPVLSGEGLQPELLEEGERNLKEFMEEEGYPEATVDNREEMSKRGALVLSYDIAAGRKVTVATVSFEGNKAISEKELSGAIQIHSSKLLRKSVYSITKLDSDVDSLATLYSSRGYLDASIIPLVSMVEGSDRLSIRFIFKEGPLSVSRSVKLQGNKTLSLATLTGKMELQPGKPYSPHIAERDRQALLAAYNDAGFLHPRVVYHVGEPDEKHSFPVSFDIEEGSRSYVDNIVVLGNNRTNDSVIDRRIFLRKDGPLSLGKMLETQQSLYTVGVFDRVRVGQQNPDSTSPYQDVVVRLDEARRNTFRYGFGYQEREHLRGTLEFSRLNVFGTGKRADLNLRGSRIEQAGVLSFQQPQFRYLPVDSNFSISGQQKQEVSFDVRRYGVSYQFSRPVSNHAWALLRYYFRNVRTSNVRGEEPGREDSPRNLSTISAIYINDTRDSYIDPGKGFFTSTDLSLTMKIIGSNNYYSLYSQNSYYHRLRSGILGVAAFRFGALQPFGGDTTIPISERYFAGGSSNLRGFDTDLAGPLNPGSKAPTGGNALIIWNLEARAPMSRPVYLAAFYDGGNVFSALGNIRFADISHTVGLGLRIKTPFGPLRLDYGFNLNLSDDLKSRGFKSGHFFVTIGPLF